ncbi:Secreted protein OS=Streptomyces fumanus OX=67302 GN=GCM10018772_24330 PE=4 SV=1 [Streptomyces fumanus]
MNTALRITAFTAALAATFGTAYGVGQGLGPVVEDSAPAAHGTHGGPSPAPEGGDGHAGHQGADTAPAGGLQVSENGYTLDLATPRVRAGERTELRFTIRDDRGRAVTAYRREHDKDLHLIVASRDLVTYRHLHPVLGADGTWRSPVDLPRAGGYRVFADFTPAAEGAENLTLGADLAASGPYRAQPLPAPRATAEVDGYQVELTGTLRRAGRSELRLTVHRDGKPVADLQPYLGAYGHLVALRSGDLAYLHVHPNGEPGDGTTKPGPAVSFTATAPSAGTYRLFLDFRHEGKVRTAAFTVRTGAQSPAHTEEAGGGHGH